MKRILKRLLGKRANTLVEVIVSMLVISMAAAMLTSGIMTATNMIQRGNDILSNLAAAEIALEQKIAQNSSTDAYIIKVDVQKGDDDYNLYVDMFLEQEPIGINGSLYYYLY